MLLKLYWALGILTYCSALRPKRIVGGYSALKPDGQVFNASQPPKITNGVIHIEHNYRTSTIYGVLEPEGYISYKGIRYAEPPIRFQRPILFRLSGEITATKYGPPCLQKKFDTNEIIGSEDCLFLNVFTPPKKTDSTNFPVLVWFHGGGFYSGSALQYGPAHLVKNKIIVVTVQYRLGSFGWLTSDLPQLPGNVGLFDMRAALKWVNEYISNFNGDPKRVVISGQGSGASAATLLAMSEFSNDIISGLFTTSGSPLSAFAVDPNPKNTYKNMTALLGCDQSEPLKAVKCLQSLTKETILDCDSDYQNIKLSNDGFLTGIGSLLNTGPAVEGFNDGHFLPSFILDSPLNSMKKHDVPSIPMLTGVNKLETKSGILGKFHNQVLQVLKTAPDFVTKKLPQNMVQLNTGLFEPESINGVLNKLFENAEYLKLITSKFGEGTKNMEKLVQGTTDALFNLPAFFTSHLWSKRSNVYFYSFEHKPLIKSPGKWFLPNMLGTPDDDGTKNDDDNGQPSHGDDLIYLFDARTIEGKPIPKAALLDQHDIQMRNDFTSLVAEFVHNGKPSLKKLDDEWPSFTSSKKSEYVVLDENPRIESKFRFCEMGLWGAVPDILQSSFCNFPGISNILNTVPDLMKIGTLDDVSGTTTKLLDKPLELLKNDNKPNITNIPGRLTENFSLNQENKKQNKKPTPTNFGSSLFSFV